MSTTTQGEMTRSFTDLGVDPDIADALALAGITSPFPIQEITLPLALSGADVIGQARTGTGKTLAFGVPLLQRVGPNRRRLLRRGAPVQCLVVVPTRELCLQVRDDLALAGEQRGVDVVAVFGGRAIEPQVEALRKGPPVVVGTPGRLLDLTNRGVLDLSGVTALVLDEADEMLDLGFLPDVERIIERTADERQTLLFSATMPAAVVALARRYMSKPTFLRADVEEVRIAPETRQHFFSCHRLDKPAVLARILQAPSRGLCLVFVRTKRMADILADDLRDRGITAAPLHSDLRQEARERALTRFREGKLDVLVATEVAARGLDIDDVTHVVNYDCPDDEKMYLHRIGRTGRAGAAGVAVTLAVWNELARLEMIKRALDLDDETHEVFSTSPILDDLFDLPPRAGERRGPTDEDWQRAVRRGEREIRKGRSGEPADDDRRASVGRTTPAQVVDSGEDPAGATRTRVRRRTRQQAGGRGTEQPAPERAGERGPSVAQPTGRQDDPGPADANVRRRVRRRGEPGGTAATDRPEGRQDADDVGGGAPPASDGDGQDSRRSRSRDGRGRTDRGGRGSGDKTQERPASAKAGARGGKQRGGERGSKQRGSKQRGGEQRGGERGSKQRGRSPGGDRRSGQGAGRRDEQAKSGSPSTGNGKASRGEGLPRLRRKLEISHLP